MSKPYSMTVPCDNCPFRRKGGIRLRESRVREIVGSNGEFHCHKTVSQDDDGDQRETGLEKVCAGFLIFNEKNDNPNQMMRIAERIGMYNAAALMEDNDAAVDAVFDDLDEMLAAQRPKKRLKKRSK